MPSIYQKYRPKTFAEMVGQNHIKLTLQNELEDDSFVHAYLFCGSRGLGKTTAARIFAKAVNCERRKKGASEPCNECASCQEINLGKSMDMIEIDAASHTGVDNVRENIIENARFSPHKSKYKVFIIDEVHMLSISAFNALLKTLEEPPSRVIFILCTTEIHKVPETIISRCQRFDFKRVPLHEVVRRLEKIAEGEGVRVDEKVLALVAQKSEGSQRDADGLLGQVLSIGGKTINEEQVSLILPSSGVDLVMDLLQRIEKNDAGEALRRVNKLADEGVDLEMFVKTTIDFLRRMMLVKLGAAEINQMNFDGKIEADALELMENLSVARIGESIRALLKTALEIKDARIQQLPLELAVVELCKPDDSEVTRIHGVIPPKITRNPVVGRGKTAEVSTSKINVSDEPDADIQQAEKSDKKSAAQNKNNDSNDDLDILEKCKKEWAQILQAAKQKGRDLLFINESSVFPVGMNEDTLMIGFQYELHCDRFAKNGNKEKFAQAVRDVTGEMVKITSRTLKPSELAEMEMEREAMADTQNKMSGVKVTEENILETVMNSFGGEVVE